ncbi:hypothetical protein JVT61DRAFT_8982 [Boletus reticuloceps]|uniref:Uncharacterized protein n=1 Tax=Boletus reticuloceps TaxID=495285 RepID=A0A8I2YH52_9AGAM|nr:hypothetical protein JVT61DRAFT_8982 [Boletus reticuloceps]
MLKPLVKFLCATALTSAVLAQDLFIASPPPYTILLAGSQVTVQLVDKSPHNRADVWIGIEYCKSGSQCPDVLQDPGQILYTGPYTPGHHEDADYAYQNMTVTIPSSWPSGLAQLGAVMIWGLGAGQDDAARVILDVVSSK